MLGPQALLRIRVVRVVDAPTLPHKLGYDDSCLVCRHKTPGDHRARAPSRNGLEGAVFVRVSPKHSGYSKYVSTASGGCTHESSHNPVRRLKAFLVVSLQPPHS